MQITIQEFVLCPEQQFDIIRVTFVSPLQIYKILPWFWKRVTAEIQEYLVSLFRKIFGKFGIDALAAQDAELAKYFAE